MREKKVSDTTGAHMLYGFLIFLFLCILQFFFNSTFSTLTYTIAKPLWTYQDHIFGTNHSLIDSIESKAALIVDKKNLEDQIYSLQIKNMELTAQIGTFSSTTVDQFLPHTPEKTVAKVIAKPPFSPFDTLILDRGLDAGITVGNVVYAGDNTVIGQVSTSRSGYAQVTLYSVGGHTQPAEIVRTKEQIDLQGVGGNNYQITVPKEFDVVLGDSIVTTDAQQSVIAIVYYIDSSSQNSFKKVLARIPFNILQTNWVQVEKN